MHTHVSRKIYSFLKTTINRFFAPKRPVYIFHHIPKAGGTSIVNVVDRWFTVVKDYRPSIELTPETLKYLSNSINFEKLNSTHCLSGHFELEDNYLHVRYPQVLQNPKGYRIFTFLREPLDLAISLYYYQIKTGGRKKDQQSLQDFLLSVSNYTANRFPCTRDNYKNVLKRYFFIGINEEMQWSLNKLAEILQKPKIEIRTLNKSPRDAQALNLPDHIVEHFKTNNELDFLIYNFGLKMFQES